MAINMKSICKILFIILFFNFSASANTNFYERGVEHIENKEYENAIENFKKAIENNEYGGHFGLGYIYDKIDNYKNDEAAIEHYTSSNSPEAKLNLGVIYYNKGKKFKQLAMDNLEIASKEGLGEAAYLMGKIYLSDEKNDENIGLAINWLEAATVLGYKPAHRTLAIAQASFIGKNFDKEKSFANFLIAAENGDIDSIFYLLEMIKSQELENKKNEKEILMQLLDKEIENNNETAILFKAKYIIDSNPISSITLFIKAIKLGNIVAISYLTLIICSLLIIISISRKIKK